MYTLICLAHPTIPSGCSNARLLSDAGGAHSRDATTTGCKVRSTDRGMQTNEIMHVDAYAYNHLNAGKSLHTQRVIVD